jgi:Uma2 family endonuclease
MGAATAEKLMTAEEFLRLADDGVPKELVRGRVITLNVPTPRHGQICVEVAYLLRRFLEDHRLGHVVSNDSGVVVERGPDTVRGADVAFYSYQRVPPGPLPRGYLAAVPELIFEVRSPTDRWGRILTKVGEYLEAGVSLVCVLDEQTQSARLFTPDGPAQVVGAEEALTFPDLLPGFEMRVERFFA